MKKRLSVIVVLLAMVLSSCGESSSSQAQSTGVSDSSYIQTSTSALTSESSEQSAAVSGEQSVSETTTTTQRRTDCFPTNYSPTTDFDTFKAKFSVADNEEWTQTVGAFTEVNDNKPFFSDTEKSLTDCFERYSELDELGRCGTAYANVGKQIMPTQKRESIGSVKPSGWQTVKYDKSVISDLYLYNRCHLIAFMLAGENANPKNLITGTRYLNIEGMLPFEDKAHDYIEKNPKNHILYRVTPLYKGKDLVARGVLMEGYSVEDKGALQFCVFCYNVQPQISIDYFNGNSRLSSTPAVTTQSSAVTTQKVVTTEKVDKSQLKTWVVNNKTMKYHYPDCSAVKKINENNKGSITASCEEMKQKGYSPCGICKPG